MAAKTKYLALALALLLVTFASCKNECRKYRELVCQNPRSPECQNALVELANLTNEQCRNLRKALEAAPARETAEGLP